MPGSAADFLIQVKLIFLSEALAESERQLIRVLCLLQSIYSLIFSTRGALNAIYPAFILTLTNISPYLKNPSIRSSTRLVQLFLAMSAPSFLLSDEANPRLVYYLIEAFGNVLQYQLSDCPNLTYAIIRSHHRFEQLATFTLAEGVVQIRKARADRLAGLSEGAAASTATLGSEKSGVVTPSSRRASMASERADLSLTTITDEEKQALFEREREQEQRQREAGGDVAIPSQSTTPVAEYPPRMSEKAMGKLRQRSDSQLTATMQSTLSTTGSLGGGDASFVSSLGEGDDAPFVAKNGFMPTEGWVASWREGMPIDPILIMIAEFLPRVSTLSSSGNGNSESSAIEYLRGATLVGLLPPAGPIRARRFAHSQHSARWLASLAWGNVYIASVESGIAWWRETPLRLFQLKNRDGNANQGVAGMMRSLVGEGLGLLNLGGGNAATGDSLSQDDGLTRVSSRGSHLSRSRSGTGGNRAAQGGVL